MPLFENYDRRADNIQLALSEYGFDTLEQAESFCLLHHFDPRKIVNETQPIAFANAGWAYTLGAAIALKKKCS